MQNFLSTLRSITQRYLLPLSRRINTFNEWVGRLTALLIVLMVGLGVWNAVARKLGSALREQLTSNAFLELQWYIFAIVFLLGAAYALKHNEHVRVDIFYKDWSPRKKALANLVGTLLFLFPFAIAVLYFSWEPVLNSWKLLEKSPNPPGIPLYPIKSMIIVGFVLLIVQGLSEAIKNLAIVLDPPTLANRTSQEERNG